MRSALCAGLLALSSAAVLKSGGGCTGTSFDFFALVTQWAITECMDVYSCTSSNQYFTMHGLWPTDNDENYPCDCTSEAFDPTQISSIMDEMNTYWPSLNGANSDFWSHEWSKHGTCSSPSITSQLDYFSTALTLRAKYDVVAALKAAGYSPSNTRGFTLSAFQNATKSAFGFESVLSCDSSGNIEEIDTCFDKDLNIMACPDTVTNDCTARTIFLPSSMA